MSHPEPIQLAPDVYCVQFGPGRNNAGFVVTGDGVVVIDSGPSPRAGEALRRAIASVTEEAPAYLVNTHHHCGHTFGNQAFQAKVIGHMGCRAQMLRACQEEWSPENIARWCEQNREQAPEFHDVRVVSPQIAFSDCGLLHIGRKMIHIIHLGNHTPDSVAVYLPDSRIVFAGDNLFSERHPFLRHANASGWAETLRRLEDLGFEQAVPGHGDAMERKAVQNLRYYFESLLRLPRQRRSPSLPERMALV